MSQWDRYSLPSLKVICPLPGARITMCMGAHIHKHKQPTFIIRKGKQLELGTYSLFCLQNLGFLVVSGIKREMISTENKK